MHRIPWPWFVTSCKLSSSLQPREHPVNRLSRAVSAQQADIIVLKVFIYVHACTACMQCAAGKAKAKAKAQVSAKAGTLSDVALAGKTVDEKLSLARCVLSFIFAKQPIHVRWKYLTHFHACSAGLECKKELGLLQSLKLEVQGKTVLEDAEKSMDKHIADLTRWYTRII